MSQKLQNITLKGFKTIRELSNFNLGPLTVLIGPNGAGKSNFLSFFRMLSWALASPGNLQFHIGEMGGAGCILHDGPGKTREVEAEMTLQTTRDDVQAGNPVFPADSRNNLNQLGYRAGDIQYSFRLAFAQVDTLIYAQEKIRFFPDEPDASWKELGAGHRESRMISANAVAFALGELPQAPINTLCSLLQKIKVFQFHDTSMTAEMRKKWDIQDNRWLREHAGNLAPVLLRLKENEPKYYQRIVENIRLVLPFFADFELNPDYGTVILSWREKNCDRIFNASQAADGMLRVMALITLLLQPDRDLPCVLILDEPELGLHPYAINVLGGLIRGVSVKTQVIVATQSTLLLDCFEARDIVVVERQGRESTFQRLDKEKLEEWLKSYSLSELWEKNVIGGRPSCD
jgi:predicted ATPase